MIDLAHPTPILYQAMKHGGSFDTEGPAVQMAAIHMAVLFYQDKLG